MTLLFTATFLLLATAAEPSRSEPASTTNALAPPAVLLQFRTDEVTVYDEAGNPRFRSDRAFALAFAGNPSGTLVEYDQPGRRVRISADGRSAAWLHCDDLVPSGSICQVKQSGFRLVPPREAQAEAAARVRQEQEQRQATSGARQEAERRARSGALRGGSEPLGRGVPNCPGDPRCPKLGGN